MSDPINDKNSSINLKKKLEEAQKQAEDKDKKAEQEEQSIQNNGIETLKTELEQMTELAKRTMADLQNLKRRQEEEKFTWIRMANAELVKSLLPIMDNLDRALAHMPESADDWHKGIEMSVNQLHKTLEEAGLKRVESVGKTFNPDLHEALAQDKGEKDIILEEFEKGYMLGDRVIRHAKVKVGNGE